MEIWRIVLGRNLEISGSTLESLNPYSKKTKNPTFLVDKIPFSVTKSGILQVQWSCLLFCALWDGRRIHFWNILYFHDTGMALVVSFVLWNYKPQLVFPCFKDKTRWEENQQQFLGFHPVPLPKSQTPNSFFQLLPVLRLPWRVVWIPPSASGDFLQLVTPK